MTTTQPARNRSAAARAAAMRSELRRLLIRPRQVTKNDLLGILARHSRPANDQTEN